MPTLNVESYVSNKLKKVGPLWMPFDSSPAIIVEPVETTIPVHFIDSLKFAKADKALLVHYGDSGALAYSMQNFSSLVVIEPDNRQASKLANLVSARANGLVINAAFESLEFCTEFDVIIIAPLAQNSDVLSKAIRLLKQTGLFIVCSNNYHWSNISEMLNKHFNTVKHFSIFQDDQQETRILADEFLKSKTAEDLAFGLKLKCLKSSAKNLNELLEQGSSSDSVCGLAAAKLTMAANGWLPTCLAVEPPQGILLNTKRIDAYQTKTVITGTSQSLQSKKLLLHPNMTKPLEQKLRWQEVSEKWSSGHSVQNLIILGYSNAQNLEQLFAPAKLWLAALQSRTANNSKLVPGELLDSSWSNAVIEKGSVEFIDQEWVWQQPIKINSLIIRAIYLFLDSTHELQRRQPLLNRSNWRSLIIEIAATLGVTLNSDDFSEFVELEAEIRAIVQNLNRCSTKRNLKLHLFNQRLYYFLRKIKLQFTS